jgi:hypothetical protein
MSLTSVQDLRRIAEAVGQLRGRVVQDVEVRSDCRSLRVTLTDGQILLVSVIADESGKSRLDVDLLHPVVDAAPHGQLEVVFDNDGD